MLFPDPDEIVGLFEVRNVSAAAIEKQIEPFVLDFPPLRSFDVEWKMKLPSFVEAFYNYYYFNYAVPSQTALWEYYQKLNASSFNKTSFGDVKEGIQARLFRAYPSLVRDLHFSAYLHEHFEGRVIYNRRLDIQFGIDVLLIFKQQIFAVNLFTDTARSKAAREKKQYRHISFDNIIYVELPIQLHDCYKCGAFFLYGEKQMNELKQKIELICAAEY